MLAVELLKMCIEHVELMNVYNDLKMLETRKNNYLKLMF